MSEKKIKLQLTPHTPFLLVNGRLNKEEAIRYGSKHAGECYSEEGWSKLRYESDKTSDGRTGYTLGLEHATPFEHVNIGFEAVNIPKIVAMTLNNEKQYTTSEKSARYTKLDESAVPAISEKEINLYNKWLDIFRIKITESYGNESYCNPERIEKLAQENARYLVSVFMPTKMTHTIPWIQLNRVISFMEKYEQKENKTEFDDRLTTSFQEFISEAERLNLIDERAKSNRKDRNLSLFGEKKIEREEFGYSYATNYKGSFAQLAQAQRHRTLSYDMQFLDEPEFFVPPIIRDDQILKDEWLNDITSVQNVNPQGELISINEKGTYENFILKAKERLCTAAQQEIMAQTRDTLLKYKEALETTEHPLAEDIERYSHGARCTFPDYNCAKDCKFVKGKNLKRKV